MKRIDVLCIGYACWDLNFQIEESPGPDEKIRASSLISEGGGPAANAAYCINRLGGKAAFAGRLGNDALGEAHFLELTKVGVDTSCILREDTATSISSIQVNKKGQRTLVNYREPPSTNKLEFGSFQPACLLMDGFEWEASKEALKKFPHIPSILDAGSLNDFTRSLANQVSHLVASSSFARDITNSDRAEDWTNQLASMAPNIAITCGERGVYWKSKTGEQGHLAARKVKALDTNGAGDIFHAAFALALTRGLKFLNCLEWANEVAAASVVREGARSSCPSYADVTPLKSNQSNASS
ncbi:MAG: PfkB family carbohydrate kinase [Verrucomicrobia bacterium]|nr:PfkB family carbohydrate kinase [Verrucomicrobiota bacterium]